MTGSLHPKVQTLTFYIAFLTERYIPFVYLLLTNCTHPSHIPSQPGLTFETLVNALSKPRSFLDFFTAIGPFTISYFSILLYTSASESLPFDVLEA